MCRPSHQKEQKVRGEGYEIPEAIDEIALYENALASWLGITSYMSSYELAAFAAHTARSYGEFEGFTFCNDVLAPWLQQTKGKNANLTEGGYGDDADESQQE